MVCWCPYRVGLTDPTVVLAATASSEVAMELLVHFNDYVIVLAGSKLITWYNKDGEVQ